MGGKVRENREKPMKIEREQRKVNGKRMDWQYIMVVNLRQKRTK